MSITKNSEQGGLHLIQGVEPPMPSLANSCWPVDLQQAPFRPGELPESLTICLDPDASKEASVKAATRGLPVALWVRVAVETRRASFALADATGATLADVEDALLGVAAQSPEAAGLSPLERYATMVSSTRPTQTREASGPLELFVPSEMALAWRKAAATSQQSLDAWVACSIRETKPGIETLEARSAGCGETLAAWCYAAFVACWSASVSASDHRRT
jgi:hypothetical protein